MQGLFWESVNLCDSVFGTDQLVFEPYCYISLYLNQCPYLRLCVYDVDVDEHCQVRTQELLFSVVGRPEECLAFRQLGSNWTVTSVTRQCEYFLAQPMEGNAGDGVVPQASSAESVMEDGTRGAFGYAGGERD